jgi:para-nitrobenzyl esterase
MYQPLRFVVAGCAVALTLALGIARAADAPAATAQTTGGTVRGTSGDVRSFKGIPFAAPPVGPLRWKAPQPPVPWSGVRDATAFGPECSQAVPPGAPSPPMSEDCLTLNVWTPAAAGAHLPVIVFIYGGGYAVGATNYPVYDGTSLARHGVVVVTANYRLNVFGFLAHPALTAESPERTSGNYGLLDQVAALKWVQANAGAFGGDARNVTIMGESAGAGSVSALMTMPRANGLYVRAIMESAPVFRPEIGLAQAESAGVALAAGASLAELRALAPADLIKRIPPLDPDTRTDLPITLGPIADGVVLPDERATYAAGKENIVPIIVGNNVNEGSFFARGVPVKTLDMYAAALQKRFGIAAMEARLLYPATDDPGALAAESTIVGDMDINTGVRKMAIAMAQRETSVYRYLFTRARAGKLPGHTAELPYVFGTPNVDGLGLPGPAFDATDQQLSQTMETMWTQFAKTGNPNPPGTNAWPAYTVGADRFIVFGDTISTGTAFRTAQLDFLNDTVGR